MLRHRLATSGAGPLPALFCDRDGVLNQRMVDGYITRPDQLKLLPTALAAARLAQGRGARIVVVSNQGVIGRGLATIASIRAVNQRLLAELAQQRIRVDGIYICPHHPQAIAPADRHCSCRKPLPGLLQQAALDLDLDLARSVMIGDQPSDILAASAAGLPPKGLLLIGEHDDPLHVAQRARVAFVR